MQFKVKYVVAIQLSIKTKNNILEIIAKIIVITIALNVFCGFMKMIRNGQNK
jgi:hypothetical protein